MALISIYVPEVPGIRFHHAGQILAAGAALEVSDDAAVASTLSIALTDELLSAQSQAGGFAMRAMLDPAQARLTLQAGAEDAPLGGLDVAGGLFEIRWLVLTIPLADTNADGVLDAMSDTGQVQASGRLRWPGAAELGFGGAVEFDLGYSNQRFTLQLPQPIDWPTQSPVLQLGAGSRVSARVLADRHPMELELGLDGTAGVAPGGGLQPLLNQATAALRQLIGGADVLPTMQQFALRQRFVLPDGGGLGARLPRWDATRLRFGLALGPGAGRAPANGSFLQAMPVSVSFGDAAFDLPTIGPDAFGAWQLRLPDVQIGFPQVQGLELPLLRGDLLVDAFDAQDPAVLALVFEPAPMQPLDLPEALRFLLAQLRWLVRALSLDELAEQAGLSLDEASWLDFFTGALGGTPSQALLEGLVEPALAVLDAERVFALLLRAIAQLDAPDTQAGWAEVAWRAWFAVGTAALPSGTDALAALARLLQQLFELAPQAAGSLVGPLFAQAASLPLQPGGFFTALLKLAAEVPEARLPDFAALCARLVALAAQHLPSGPLAAEVAAALLDLLRPSQRLPGLEALAPALPLPAALFGEVRPPLADWLVGQVLAALAVGPMQLAPPVGWDRVPGLADTTVAALAALVQGVEVLPSRLLAMFQGLFASMDLASLDDPDERALALEREWTMLNLVRRYPPAALLLIPASIGFTFCQFPGVFARLVGKDVEKDADLVTARLHEPGPGTRYLIVSDLHRDAASDDLGLLNFGSIDHFSDNRALYRQVLAWVRDNGVTLIENGDCEELWYIREAFEYATPKAKMQAILAHHCEVYADLWELHAAGRYWRVIGNHDSYLREMMSPVAQGGVTRPWLQWQWKAAADLARSGLVDINACEALKLHDFLVIDGVKTMADNGFFELIGDAWALPANPQAAVTEMLKGRLGMDAADYTEKKPMLVCHGHQFDVWNSDQTAVIGKLISNGVGVPVDQLMDPFLDLRGIALAGSALLDFRNLLGGAPLANNWLADSVALRMAHQIQHQDDVTRLPIDDVMFSESMAMLFGSYSMPLDQPVWDGDSVERDGSGEIVVAPLPLDPLFRLGNHLCIGHTHIPQSQPYYQIPDPFAAPLRPLVEAAQGAVNALLPLGLDYTTDSGVRVPLRSRYYNTGTASWFRGVIWGIEITPSGQARAVFFTENSRGPETMEWELTDLDDGVRQRIAALTAALPDGNLFDWLAARLAEARDHLGERFADAMAQLGVSRTVALPLQALLFVDASGAAPDDILLERIDSLGGGAGSGEVEAVSLQLARLQAFFFRLVALLVQRQAGVGASVNGRSFSVRLAVDSATRQRLQQLRELFAPLAGNRADQLAAACFLALYRLPMLGADPVALPSALRMLQGRAPVLVALLSLAATLPFGVAAAPAPGGVALRASLGIDGDAVVLSVQLQEAP
ncbi:MAG: hypothetical protein MUF16_00665 [Burkholderiaceae bacterium]|nr:hypothetical protein [Burkholderiaceae bacterium]